MSRHRDVRNLDFGEEFDDLEGHSYSESEPEPSPETRANYMYNDQPSTRPLSEWGATGFHPSDNQGDQSAAPEEEEELLSTATAEVTNVLGEAFSAQQVNSALKQAKYNAETAVAILLDTKFEQFGQSASSQLASEQEERTTGIPSGVVGMLDEEEESYADGVIPDLSDPSPNTHVPTQRIDPDLIFQFDTPSPDDLVIQKQLMSALRSSTPAFSKKPNKQADNILSSELGRVKIGNESKATTTGSSKSQQLDKEQVKTKNDLARRLVSTPPHSVCDAPTSAATKQRLKTLPMPVSPQSAITVVVVGHVDAGKSTLVGYLMKHVAKIRLKKTRGEEESLAWIADIDPVEQERGVTIDTSVHHLDIPISGRHVVLIDSPGHRDFVPAMIIGASQAGAALMIVDASPGEFEAGFSEDGQTREHGLLLRGLGITDIVVVINKMDLVDFDESRFRTISSSVATFLKKAGLESSVVYVPCAGICGANVVERATGSHPLAKWYKGPSLLEQLDALALPDFREQQSRPTIVSVMDVSKSLNFGAVSVTGVIVQGSVAAGDRLLIQPLQVICTVKAVRAYAENSSGVVVAGQTISLGLSGGGTELDPSQILTGSVLCDPERPLRCVRRFEGQLMTMPLVPRPLVHGSPVIVHVGSGSSAGKLIRIRRLLGKAGGSAGAGAPRCLLKNQMAEVEVELSKAMPVAAHSATRALGRFLLRDKGRTLAAGIIVDIGSAE